MGNPACVILLEEELPYDEMLKIAAHNGLPETACVLDRGNELSLRWFTPDLEMDLCGHATLASAHVVFTYCPQVASAHRGSSWNSVRFATCEGEIEVTKASDCSYILNFPQRLPVPAELPAPISDSLSIKPQEVYLSRDYLLIYNNEDEIRNIGIIDRHLFDSVNLGQGGVIVSARGGKEGGYDFVSRFFTPQATILEDPVTGSAHCTLAPFWGEILGKTTLKAAQLSENGGELLCELRDGRVFITGAADTKKLNL